MPRNPRIPGEGSGERGREKSIAPVMKERQRKSVGRHMRTFARTKKQERMTTYDDVDYLTFMCGVVDSTACAYLANGVTEAYTRGQKVGNMKEEVAAQKTALTTTVDKFMELGFDLTFQWPVDNLLANYPRQDTLSVAGVSIAHYNEATMTDILQQMDGLEIPSVCKSILNTMAIYFKISQGWTDVSNNDIPARYICPFMPLNASATNIALITEIWAEQGELKMHAKKFGIKLEKFSPDWLVPKEIPIKSKDALAFFQHASIHNRNSANTGDDHYEPMYPMSANGQEAKRYWFYEDPNESTINYLAGLLQEYEVDHNKYGGALSGHLVPATADAVGIKMKFTESTGPTVAVLTDIIEFLKEYLCMWENHGAIGFEWTGTEVSNLDLDLANVNITWFKGIDENLYYGTGIDEISSRNTMLSYLIELMF